MDNNGFSSTNQQMKGEKAIECVGENDFRIGSFPLENDGSFLEVFYVPTFIFPVIFFDFEMMHNKMISKTKFLHHNQNFISLGCQMDFYKTPNCIFGTM